MIVFPDLHVTAIGFVIIYGIYKEIMFRFVIEHKLALDKYPLYPVVIFDL